MKKVFEVNYRNIPQIKHMFDFNGDVLTTIKIDIPSSEKRYEIRYLRPLCYINGFKPYFWTVKFTRNDEENYYLNLQTNSYECVNRTRSKSTRL